ncbi:Cas10/Cmr2 second palm domain-containing protein [Actinomadura algeriensis]|uniref:Cas10/Cmr2 second palm domain-containing protein n=1 Tax=Actinomadura algeriensis TaxID=1679523 RepID=A0ABR9JU91_9ACTN|nr:hypothetical protein [Actinomadura algeriensis]MBE1533973.1 hypothetical protein [Actinomadura algeriensis]
MADALGGGGEEHRFRDHGVEVMAANAGGVTLLVERADEGRRIVAEVTGRALQDAPGLDVCGVVGDEFELTSAAALADAVEKARGALLGVRMARPGPDLRFLGLPIAARCTSSGLPAARIVQAPKPKDADERPTEPRSAPSLAKLDAFPHALARLADDMGVDERKLAGVVEHLNDRAEWVAVVHADGNAMGKVFREFPQLMTGDDDPFGYVERFRELSAGVDECTRTAFRRTVEELDGEVPKLLPLVLGGDDVTVVCDGDLALPFAERYLANFAEESAAHPHVGQRMREAGYELERLGACAGVAIVKRNYPFHSAADLAEELTAEAKRVKEELDAQHCALSFHVLQESAFTDLGRLRREARVGEDVRLTAQPYVVGDGDAGHRHWDGLKARVRALVAEREGERVIPSGQAHELRAGLFHGRDVADARFGMLRTWLGADDVAALACDEGSLFWTDDEGMTHTGLLDAMNAAPFLPKEA